MSDWEMILHEDRSDEHHAPLSSIVRGRSLSVPDERHEQEYEVEDYLGQVVLAWRGDIDFKKRVVVVGFDTCRYMQGRDETGEPWIHSYAGWVPLEKKEQSR